MNLVKRKTAELKPAKYNPRKTLKSNSPEYIKIKNSIVNFGYVDPIIVNKDGTIIGGHQRFKVLKDLEYEEIDVIELDVSKEEEKALNLALNKVSGLWDEEKVNELLIDLKMNSNIDLTLTGFDIKDFNLSFGDDEEEIDVKQPNERIRTNKAYNLGLYDETDVDGFYQMPIIRKEKVIPSDLIGFNYMLTSKNKKTGIHMFIDDYQFERLWNNPDEYTEELSKYQCVLSPDFSLYMDMPMAMKIWNIYRSRMLGQYWQRQGIRVIPTISWAESATFNFCFDGVEIGSTVAISTIGVKRDEQAMKVWSDGVTAMIQKIHPACILVYGGELPYDYGNIKVIYFNNKVTEKMKNIGDEN